MTRLGAETNCTNALDAGANADVPLIGNLLDQDACNLKVLLGSHYHPDSDTRSKVRARVHWPVKHRV
eukprot:4673125-Amphidinium_carterae.7